MTFIFLSLIGSGWYLVQKRLNPEEIKKLTQNELSKVFPNGSVQLGEVDISIGFTSEIKILKLSIDIKNKRRNISLLKLNNVSVKIPAWSILRGEGAIDIALDSPLIIYEEFNKTNNWQFAIGQESKKEEPSSSGNETLPDEFLSRFKLNLIISKLDFLKKDTEGKELNLKVSSLEINDFNFLRPINFKLASKLKLPFDKSDNIDFETILDGTLDLSSYFKDKTFAGVCNFNFENIKFSLLKGQNIPDINGEVKFSADSSLKVTKNIQISAGEVAKLNLNVNIDKNMINININQIKAEVIIIKLLSLFNIQEKRLNIGQSKVLITGDAQLGKKIIPNLNVKISSPIEFKHKTKLNIMEFNSLLSKGQLSVNTELKAMDGIIKIELMNKFNVNSLPESLGQLNNIVVKVKANGVNINKNFIESFTTKHNGKTKKVKAKSEQMDLLNLFVGLPKADVSISLRNSMLLSDSLEGTINTHIVQGKIKSEISLNLLKGKINLENTTIAQKKRITSKFTFGVNKLKFNSIQEMLPPNLGKISGNINLKSSGTLSFDRYINNIQHKIKFDLNASKGKIKHFNLSQYLNNIIKKIPVLHKSLKNRSYKINQTFERLSVKSTLSTMKYNFKKIYFKGLNNKIEIKSSGFIFPNSKKKQSKINVSYLDHTGLISKPLAKNFDTKELPLMLKGYGFSLTPDYKYTISKLSKNKLKKIKKKQTKKLKKSIKKEIDKKIKNKKIKNLLNGFL